MKERPILFSAPMVRAILAGTKTQTRRLVKGVALEWLQPGMFSPEFVVDRGNGLFPYGPPGDRLWVRESIKATRDGHGYISGYVFAADGKAIPRDPDLLPQFADHMAFAHRHRDGGVPSIHMPRWASRITLEVTGVRVERLQDISEADAIAEGVERTVTGDGWRHYSSPDWEQVGLSPMATARQSFFTLWNQINGQGSWTENPWVWVIDFKRIEGQA